VKIGEEQQDAEEFLQALLSLLFKEEVRCDFSPKVSEVTVLEEEKKQEDVYFQNLHHSQFSLSSAKFPTEKKMSASMRILTSSDPPSIPLAGWIGSHLKCCKCNHVRPLKNTPFLDLPILLNYKEVDGACTLQECLQNFTSMERVNQVECWNCAIQKKITFLKKEIQFLNQAIDNLRKRNFSCPNLQKERDEFILHLNYYTSLDPDDSSLQQLHEPIDLQPEILQPIRSDAYKSLFITRLPSILCIHVQRRYYDPTKQTMQKTNQHIIFDEYLDLSKYMILKTKAPIKYQLVSVVEHTGSAFSGHYQTYRRTFSTKNNKPAWVLISDQHVQFIPSHIVFQSQAYMLFYEAI